jgi:site-specific DNA-methyltransferase (adenine-specific)
MSIQLLQGDCLEVMKGLQDKSIDCFICDLPYGCLAGGGKEKKQRRFKNGVDTNTEIIQSEGVIAGCSWDVKIDLEKFWIQVERLMKNDNTPIIHFCTMRFGYELIQSKPSWFRYDMVWEKTNAVGFLHANKQPLRAHENIFIFSKKGSYYERKDIKGDFKAGGGGISKTSVYQGVKEGGKGNNEGKRCLRSVIEVSSPRGKGKHPTQKPIELYKMLIERYCIPGGTLLDPTAGSFGSCIAGYELGRTCIGIEMDTGFYNTAVKRVKELDGDA